MIRMHNLPDHILQALKPYYKKGEIPDVFPSKFSIRGKMYYFFTFAPAAEQLIMEESGVVPKHDMVKDVALIATDYNHSIESTVHKGGKWADIKNKENYLKLQTILDDVEGKLGPIPDNLTNDLNTFQDSVATIVSYQDQIVDIVKKVIVVWDKTEKKELVTEEEQIEVRGYIFELANAAFKQNEVQIQTEKERNKVFDYVSKKRGMFNLTSWLLYIKLIPYQKFMLKSDYNPKMEELRKKLSTENPPLDQGINVEDILGHLRNPR